MLVHRNRYTAVCVDVVADVLGLWFVQFWSHFCSLLFLFSTRRAPAPRAGPAAAPPAAPRGAPRAAAGRARPQPRARRPQRRARRAPPRAWRRTPARVHDAKQMSPVCQNGVCERRSVENVHLHLCDELVSTPQHATHGGRRYLLGIDHRRGT